MVTHKYPNTVYNMSNLKYQHFYVNDDIGQFRFSVCSPLRIPCNGSLDSAACWSINGTEKNIGLYTEQIVNDNGKLFMTMQGEKCFDNGPDSYTTIQFVCDFLDSKAIDYKKVRFLLHLIVFGIL